MKDFGYLAIGHITRDVNEEGKICMGGTVAYAACAANALLDSRVGIITSVSPTIDLSQLPVDITVENVPTVKSTTFKNKYTHIGRTQTILSCASQISAAHVPLSWTADIVHIGPVIGECDISLLDRFSGKFIGITPQGWMRKWDAAGHVSMGAWKHVAQWLSHADAVVFSDEDVDGDWDLIHYYASLTHILVVTQNHSGCTVCVDGSCTQYIAQHVENLVDATGAGDIFATVFFIALQHNKFSVEHAAVVANAVAAESTKYMGLDSALHLLDYNSKCGTLPFWEWCHRKDNILGECVIGDGNGKQCYNYARFEG